MDEKMRADFEAWWREENGNRLYCESAWRGWQASRAALVVELPALPPKGTTPYAERKGASDMHSKFRLAITSAGVRVKP